MSTYMLIVKVLGPLFVVVGAGMLLNADHYRKAMLDFNKSPSQNLFFSMIPLAFGVWILAVHNVWECSWKVLITIFGWIGIAKGVGLLVFPRPMSKLVEGYVKSKWAMTVNAVAGLLLGLVLIYYGYLR